MSLAYADGPRAAYDEDELPAPEVDEAMERRKFLAAVMGTVVPAVWGSSVPQHLLVPFEPLRPAVLTPLPSQLAMSDVDALVALTDRMRSLARLYGGQGDTLSAISIRSMRLQSVPATDPIKRSLQAALANLNICAGWACVDTQLDDQAQKHFATAIQLANDGGDPGGIAYALWLSGTSLDEQGHPNDALKLYQLGQLKLTDAHDDPRAPWLGAWLHAESASSYAHINRADLARSELAAARDEWDPPDANERADMDWLTSLVERDLGRLDVSEHFAASAVRTWDADPDRRRVALASITLAELHLKAREPDGLHLAHNAVIGVAQLRSQRARKRLEPLTAALEARSNSDAKQLARMARQVAATRA